LQCYSCKQPEYYHKLCKLGASAALTEQQRENSLRNLCFSYLFTEILQTGETGGGAGFLNLEAGSFAALELGGSEVYRPQRRERPQGSPVNAHAAQKCHELAET